ncbi:class I SAM-dependent DNA methyltransferase [Pseudomonas xionganensis]|uniref:Methyltransferase domain-containing protein n=1 Tax=Pseudomonas xionganensis TaxID=2654845 RepID=A0A6I4KV84_9PSED|nr:class I SAM-dependent methyltransferase [Pseudomonas xionganensis]MVW75658.1 methyltransferase domain-containing protein [Pseudomonas xionganensis]
MTTNALYTDLSGYYDLMCADIDYPAQSQMLRRLHQLFGNQGRRHLDLACGSGPHVRHFIDMGFASSGLDLNQPMLELARQRCPEAQFSLQDMRSFAVAEAQDLITCFLYSLHYCGDLAGLGACLGRVHAALSPAGLFCFNAVDKTRIDNCSWARHTAVQGDSQFVFSSGWHYQGQGDRQSLRLAIEKTTQGVTQSWEDEHPMVAVDFAELQQLLAPDFEVHVLAHDYQKIEPWDGQAGNALFVCVKK